MGTACTPLTLAVMSHQYTLSIHKNNTHRYMYPTIWEPWETFQLIQEPNEDCKPPLSSLVPPAFIHRKLGTTSTLLWRGLPSHILHHISFFLFPELSIDYADKGLILADGLFYLESACWTNNVSTLLLLGICSLNVLLAHSIAVNTSHRSFGYYKPRHTSPLLN